MADDRLEIVGKWIVNVKGGWTKSGWTWEYVFSPDGTVRWRDIFNSSENGVGHWAMSPTLINMSWHGSETRESWRRPITPTMGPQKCYYAAPYYTGPYEAEKDLGPAPRATDVNPSVADLPWERYVDNFVDPHYDMNYKIPMDRSFAYSPFLQLTYGDGVRIELDIEKDFSTAPMSPDEARNAMAKATVGRGGRIFPTALNFRTTPRLWRARADAFAMQDQNAGVFMGLSVMATAFVLGVPAMPAGALEEAAVLSTAVTRRAVPGTSVPPAAIQGNMVRLGAGNTPGSLWASIQQTSKGVVYRVEMIVLQGKGAEVATARATHREMIRRAAQTAQSSGQRQFQMVGKQANSNFIRHADQLAKEVGVSGSGVQGSQSIGYPDYTVTLDVAKVLSSP